MLAIENFDAVVVLFVGVDERVVWAWKEDRLAIKLPVGSVEEGCVGELLSSVWGHIVVKLRTGIEGEGLWQRFIGAVARGKGWFEAECIETDWTDDEMEEGCVCIVIRFAVEPNDELGHEKDDSEDWANNKGCPQLRWFDDVAEEEEVDKGAEAWSVLLFGFEPWVLSVCNKFDAEVTGFWFGIELVGL